MLSTIIAREIFEGIYSYRFLFFLLIGITLIPIGLYVNRVDYSKRLSDYDEQVRLENKTIAATQFWDLVSGSIPLKGFLEPSPLAVFARGLEGSLPQFYTFKPSGYESVASGEEGSSFELGKLDFAFVVQSVISLIVLIFGADTVSGEKELGTLRDILSNSVPRDTILFGKLIGGYIAIWFPFALSYVAGILILSLTSFPLSGVEMLSRIFLIFAISSAFLVIYFSIGMMISSMTSSTRTSLIAVVVAWAFLQLVIPKVGGMAAALIYPIKTETVLSMEKAIAVNSLENEKSKVLGNRYQQIFGSDTILTFDSGQSAEKTEWDLYREEVLRNYGEKETAQIHSMDESYEREKSIQQGIATGLSLLSPSTSFGYLITDLCGTGLTDRKKFVDAVAAYQQTLDRELFGLVGRTSIIFPGGNNGVVVSIRKVGDSSPLPTLSVQRAGLSEIFSNNAGSLISLVLWLIIPFVIAYRKFLKYDVR